MQIKTYNWTFEENHWLTKSYIFLLNNFKKILLTVLLLSLLIFISCKPTTQSIIKSEPNTPQNSPSIGGGCGVEPLDDFENQSVKVKYITVQGGF